MTDPTQSPRPFAHSEDMFPANPLVANVPCSDLAPASTFRDKPTDPPPRELRRSEVPWSMVAATACMAVLATTLSLIFLWGNK